MGPAIHQEVLKVPLRGGGAHPPSCRLSDPERLQRHRRLGARELGACLRDARRDRGVHLRLHLMARRQRDLALHCCSAANPSDHSLGPCSFISACSSVVSRSLYLSLSLSFSLLFEVPSVVTRLQHSGNKQHNG